MDEWILTNFLDLIIQFKKTGQITETYSYLNGERKFNILFFFSFYACINYRRIFIELEKLKKQFFFFFNLFF